jgi:hypothetical protein
MSTRKEFVIRGQVSLTARSQRVHIQLALEHLLEELAQNGLITSGSFSLKPAGEEPEPGYLQRDDGSWMPIGHHLRRGRAS